MPASESAPRVETCRDAADGPTGSTTPELSDPADKPAIVNTLLRVSTGIPQKYVGRMHGSAPPGCLPVMENAESLSVQADSDPASPVVAELQAHTRLCVVETAELSDGTRRARITRHGQPHAAPPVGWVTARTAEGRALIHNFARPLYEVDLAVKLREGEKKDSRFVCQLAPGTRVHVVANGRAGNDTSRVRVALVDQDEPVGWLSVRTAAGTCTIRDLEAPSPWTPPKASPAVEKLLQRASPHLRRERATSAHSPVLNDPRTLPAASKLPAPGSRSPPVGAPAAAARRSPSPAAARHPAGSSQSSPATSRSPSASGASASQPRVTAGAPAASSKSRSSKALPATATPPTAAPAAPQAPAAAPAPAPAAAPAPAKKFGLGKLGKLGGLKSLLSKAVAAEGVAVPTASSSDAAAKPAMDFGAVVKSALKEFSCPGSGLNPKSAHLAVEDASNTILALYADAKSNVFRTAGVEAAVARYEQSARDEEKAANGTSLSAQIGEVLSGKGAKKLDDLVKEWDPNGDGSVTKQEFRLCVRKLFKK